MILIIQFTRVMTTTRNKTRKDGDNDEDTKFNLTTAGGVNRAGLALAAGVDIAFGNAVSRATGEARISGRCRGCGGRK